MRRMIAVAVLVGAFAVPAMADEVACNATTCYTADEYAETFSVDNLVQVGIYADPQDNGDGTVTVTDVFSGARITVGANPLERPVAATPSDEPEAPTVREVLFPRAAFGVHPI